MSYPINYPTPQGANIQIFQGSDTGVASRKIWVKPQGASFVFFTLIGGGGGGSGSDASGAGSGGASGAVANFMCPAFLIPDEIQIRIGRGGAGGATSTAGSAGTDTYLLYKQKNGVGYTLLSVAGGGGAALFTGGTAAAATVDNNFTAMGFFNSVAGQAGANSGLARGASSSTFLSGGSGGMASATLISTTGNYGYVVSGSASNIDTQTNGFFQTQPIIVGVGGAAHRSSDGTRYTGGKGGAGCGGAGGSVEITTPILGTGGAGGDGLAIIVTW